MGRISRAMPAMAGVLLAAAAQAQAPSTLVQRDLTLAPGPAATAVKGSIRGRQTVDHRLAARAGQTLSVEMQSDHGANHFNVLPPGSRDVALFVGSIGGRAWRDIVPADGHYTIRVYLMRSAARRQETAHYVLTVGLQDAPAGDARVRGTPYHATGELPCHTDAAASGATMCAFGVIRGAPGHAQLHVTRPDGQRRILNFSGPVVSADDGSATRAERVGDAWQVEVGTSERYRVPDAVIQGG